MIDYVIAGKCRLQRKHLQHDISKVIRYDATKCDITNAVGKSFPFVQAIFNKKFKDGKLIPFFW